MTPSSVPASPSDAWTGSPTPASEETPRLARNTSIASGAPADAVNGLVAKYHHEAAPGGRRHRFVVALHPTITHTKEPQS